MKRTLFCVVSLAVTLAAVPVSASPRSEVKAAAKALLKQQEFSWTATVTNSLDNALVPMLTKPAAMDAANTTFEISGTKLRNGVTTISAPERLLFPSRVESARAMTLAFRGDSSAGMVDNAWLSPLELARLRESDGAQAGTARAGGTSGGSAWQIEAPRMEKLLKRLLGELKNVRADRDAITADISRETLDELLESNPALVGLRSTAARSASEARAATAAMDRMANGYAPQPSDFLPRSQPRFQQTSGRVSFLIRDGRLQSWEMEISGTIPGRGSREGQAEADRELISKSKIVFTIGAVTSATPATLPPEALARLR